MIWAPTRKLFPRDLRLCKFFFRLYQFQISLVSISVVPHSLLLDHQKIRFARGGLIFSSGRLTMFIYKVPSNWPKCDLCDVGDVRFPLIYRT
jgi:hypothetical protein